DHFVPGVGPLLRPGGRSLDEVGEALHEAGYLGPPDTTPRPTEGEVIALLDDLIRTGERRYAVGDAPPPRAEEDDGALADLRARFLGAAETAGEDRTLFDGDTELLD